jgi:hypothetical protein
MSLDPVKLATALAEKVKAALAPLEMRLRAVEARTPLVGEKGDTGEPGARGADGTHGRDGVNGKDGVDGAPGKDGRDGVDGKDGAPGRDGADGLHGKGGADGLHGKDGRDGVDGKDGSPGADGPAGSGIATASIDGDGKLTLVLSDGRVEKVGVVVGAPGRDGRDGQQGVPGRWGEKGADGKDGVDGLGFDDFDVQHDGERGFTFVISRGERKKTFGPFAVPVPIYRGVFEDGKTYHAHDEVTFGGHVWLARQTTTVKPDEHTPDGKRAWLLVVRRGRDGKAGPEGKPGPQGPRGQG